MTRYTLLCVCFFVWGCGRAADDSSLELERQRAMLDTIKQQQETLAVLHQKEKDLREHEIRFEKECERKQSELRERDVKLVQLEKEKEQQFHAREEQIRNRLTDIERRQEDLKQQELSIQSTVRQLKQQNELMDKKKELQRRRLPFLERISRESADSMVSEQNQTVGRADKLRGDMTEALHEEMNRKYGAVEKYREWDMELIRKHSAENIAARQLFYGEKFKEDRRYKEWRDGGNERYGKDVASRSNEIREIWRDALNRGYQIHDWSGRHLDSGHREQLYTMILQLFQDGPEIVLLDSEADFERRAKEVIDGFRKKISAPPMDESLRVNRKM